MIDNNKMISLNQLIDNCFNNYRVCIPLLQRNYKWDKETASKLASDLWNSFMQNPNAEYTMGMITTFYEENEQKLQIIDGQQRVITLTLILKFLNSQEEYFNFTFERDEGINNDKLRRSTYLQNINKSNIEEKYMYTDLNRFKENFDAIKAKLQEVGYKESKKNEFINYILDRVYILFHMTQVEPKDEFLNINKNKTRFVISDHIKANLIIDTQKSDVEKNSIDRQRILDLFKNLSSYLFDNNNNDIWELVKQRYVREEMPSHEKDREKNLCYPDENRLKILFCDRYDGNSKLGYEYKKEFERLAYYSRILDVLKNDTKNNDWNEYNGFNCIHKIKRTKFFEMFGKKYSNNILKQSLEDVMWNKVKNDKVAKSYFIESQLYFKKIDTEIFEGLPRQNSENWVYISEKEIEIFKEIYEKYTLNSEFGEMSK